MPDGVQFGFVLGYIFLLESHDFESFGICCLEEEKETRFKILRFDIVVVKNFE